MREMRDGGCEDTGKGGKENHSSFRHSFYGADSVGTGAILPPRDTWQCLEAFLMPSLERECYWPLVCKDQGCS